jgi:GGDEF domain-containing protein
MSTAYLCDRETFSYIYNLEQRRSGREWNNSCFSRIKIDDIKGINLEKASEKLKEVLIDNLRQGDLVCRWEDDNYMIILNDINKKNTDKVMERIYNNYFKKYTDNKCELLFDYKLF